jgi:hypothetical protein
LSDLLNFNRFRALRRLEHSCSRFNRRIVDPEAQPQADIACTYFVECAYRDTWWSCTGSNRGPPACKAGALPTELQPLVLQQVRLPSITEATRLKVVGLGRFELPTSPLSGVRSNQLSYRPDATPSTSLVSIQEAADAQAALLPEWMWLSTSIPEVSSLERFRGHS